MSSGEPVRVECPECGAALRVRASRLGDRVTCPKCAREFVAQEAGPPPTVQPLPLDDEEADRGRARPRRADWDDDDFAPDRNGADPEPETCPQCGDRRFKKVSYTWWGGVLGPAPFSLVECKGCGQRYNRKTGKPIGTAHILLYSLVLVAIGGALILAVRLAAGQ